MATAAEWVPPANDRWVQIQQNTFTKWVNHQLKPRNIQITNLATDFSDGVNLIHLAEVLAAPKTVGKFTANPKFITQKHENTLLAMNFFIREGVTFVNIGNTDIVEGNLKLILGLIWTLIFRYHITKGKAEASAKNELLQWVRSKIPEYDIKNFTKDWNDGRAICALANAIGPGICPNHWDLEGTPLERATKGVNLAQKRLDIPPVLNPADMVSPDIDDLSVMTYVSFFRNACLNDLPLPRAEGPGLIEGKVGEEAPFKIFRNHAEGDLSVEILDSKGRPVRHELTDNGDDTYSVVYFPTETGKHKITIQLDKIAIPQSPFFPMIYNDLSRVRAYGPGLEAGKVGVKGPFVVEPHGNAGVLGVKVVAPSGKEVPATISQRPDGDYDCFYVPEEAGHHVIAVTMDTEDVPNSPFHVEIEPDVSRIRAYGPGLIGGKVGHPGDFVVEPNGNDGRLAIVITDPLGDNIPVSFKKNARGDYDCVYTPKVSGKHTVDITMNEQAIPESPFHPLIAPDITKIRAHGPGLIGGMVGRELDFVVEPNGNDGDLTIDIFDPAGRPVPVSFEKNARGDYDAVYTPTVSGRHTIDIKMNGEHIPESAFHPLIEPDITKIRAYGPGLIGGKVGHPADFIVEPNGNDGDLGIVVTDPEGTPVPVSFQKNPQGDYECVYVPKVSGKHQVSIKMNGQEIPESPFHPLIAPDITKIRAHGPGLITGMVGKPGDFVVEPNGNYGDLTIVITDPVGDDIPVSFQKNARGDYDCVYTPKVAGEHTVDIKMNGEHIPESAFHPVIEPDVSKIRAHGPGLVGGMAGLPTHFTIEPEGNVGDIRVEVADPRGEPISVAVSHDAPTGNYLCRYLPPIPGIYDVTITCNGQHIPGSVFHPDFEADVTKIRAYGPGLEEGTVHQPAPFVVETNLHDGRLTLRAEGPEGDVPVMSVKDPKTSNYDCQYVPVVPGEYLIHVHMNGKDVPDSPFYVVIQDDFRNVRCQGPGLEGGFVDFPSEFTIFPNGHVGKLKVWVEGPEDPAVATVTQTPEGNYGVVYTPTAPGEYYVNVTMDDIHVPNSPFLVLVLAKKRSGPSLGGEGKIRVFYTSTSASEKVKVNQKKLQDVLEKRRVHLRPDFEPWIALDVGLEKGFRDMVFKKAGRREPPLMFIDDEPAPPAEEIFKMEEEGTFDQLLKYMPKFDV